MKMAIRGAITGLMLMAGTAATAATVTVDVPDLGNFVFYGSGNTSVTYDGVVFSTSAALGNGSFFNVGPSFSGAAVAVLSSQGAEQSLANILISLPVFATSASITFSTFGGTDVVFLLSSGGLSVLGNPGAANLYDLTTTYSSGAAAPFNSIQLTTGDEGLNIGSITYTTAIPEPATWALMIVGFGLVGAAARRRQTATA